MTTGEGGQDAGLPAPKPDLRPNLENILDKFQQVSVIDAEKGFVSGRQLKEHGQEVAVRDIFGDDPQAEIKRLVYFRTVSGNICQMEKVEGKLVLRSAKDALLKKGEGIGFENYLDWEDHVGNGKLKVGDPFFLTPSIPTIKGHSSSIGEIEEIVIFDPGVISDPNQLSQLPKNLIIEDFDKLSGRKAGLSPEPQQVEEKTAFQTATEIFRNGKRQAAELADFVREGKIIEFLERVIPVLRSDKKAYAQLSDQDPLSIARSIIYENMTSEDFEAAVKGKTTIIDGQEVKMNLLAVRIDMWLSTAYFLSKFQGNEGLEAYRGIMDAVDKGDLQQYLNVMIKSKADPRIKEVAKAVVLDLFADHKLTELGNFERFDPSLVSGVFDSIL